jgi:hypothetical protein
MTVDLDNDEVKVLLRLLNFKEGWPFDPKAILSQAEFNLVVKLTKIQMKLELAQKLLPPAEL